MTVSSFPLTITAGETSGTATFTLPTKNDNIYESDETIDGEPATPREDWM